MTGLTDFDIREAGYPFPFNVAVAERAIQFSYLFVMDMIETDRLIDRDPGKDWEDRIKDAQGLRSKSVVGNGGKEENHENSDGRINPSSHWNSLFTRP